MNYNYIHKYDELNSILRRHYGFITTASWEKTYFIGVCRFATPLNTKYIFSQLAVIIKLQCRLKIELIFLSQYKLFLKRISKKRQNVALIEREILTSVKPLSWQYPYANLHGGLFEFLATKKMQKNYDP